jgi:hypothetical protein
MKISDAAGILGVNGALTSAAIKTAFRRACSQYHPDKGGCVEMMKLVNNAYEVLKDFEGDIQASNEGYSDVLNEALNQIMDLPNIDIEVCGNWIWVAGDTKAHSEILGKNGVGFFYARKKRAWYFRPADYKSAARGKLSLDEIRDIHGSKTVNSRSQTRLA